MNTKITRQVLGMLGEERFGEGGLTEVQARRAGLVLEGLGPAEIARREGVTRSSVSRSIEGARAKAFRAVNEKGPEGQRSQLERGCEARYMREVFGI